MSSLLPDCCRLPCANERLVATVRTPRPICKPVGSCDWSDICVFSFHPVKIVTTGEGGAAATQSEALATSMRLLRSHGITRDKASMTRDDGPWYYEQQALGWNYRLTDIAAALGTSQMRNLVPCVEARRLHAAAYDEAFGGLGLVLPKQHPDTASSWHLYVVQVERADHLRIFEGLRAGGIGVNLHYIPVHLQPWYRKMGFRAGQFPEAERYYERAISLPIFPGLSVADRSRVIGTLADLI